MTEPSQMRADWNQRALADARWHIASDVKDEQEFVTSGARDVEKALRRLFRPWLKTARMLEIGCGAGRMSAYLLDRVASLVAVDVSTEMIALATARLGHHPNVRLEATNGVDLSIFEDGSFDLVLCYVVFQHIPNAIVRQYFREIRRVLASGGLFRGQVAHITDPDFVQPPDSDTFSMRSWSVEEVRSEFADWHSLWLEVIPVTPTTDHIWITAIP